MSGELDNENGVNYVLVVDPHKGEINISDVDDYYDNEVKVRKSERGKSMDTHRIRYDGNVDTNDYIENDDSEDLYKGVNKNDKDDPRNIWHRKKKENGQKGYTKSFYNKDDKIITRNQFIQKIKTYIKNKNK